MKSGAALLALLGLLAGAGARLERPPGTGLTETCHLRYGSLQTELGLWDKVADPRWQEVREKSDSGPDRELARVFGAFCDRVEAAFPFRRAAEPDPQDESWVWAKLTAERLGVDRLFESFRRFLQQPAPGPRPWEDLAETVLQDPTNSVPKALDTINRLVMHSNFYSEALRAHTQTGNNQDANSHLCNLQQSPHQLLYNMYNTIALTEIKGYTMMQFSWMLLRIYGKGNFTRESNLMRQRFVDRSTMTLAAVKSALSDASREIWRCDPQHHEEGETFVALTRLLQGYVENEVDMNSENTCRENCAYYSYAKNHGCFKDQFCSRQPPCKGKILNCQYIDSDMWICPAPRNSERRYEFIEYENQRVLGQKGSCMTGTSKVDSWWRWLFWHCSFCMCLCDQEGPNSHRHFSLWETLADTYNNRVVTGIRFTKVKKVIHLQISEGILLPRGKIDTASVRWRPVIPLDITDSSLEKGRDFHTMSYEERSLDLDDLDGPLGHLLTGVRFRKIGSHLNFEIRVTPFNFTTGKLISPKEKSMWISNDNTDAASHKPRTRLNLHKPDIPTRSAAASLPDSHSDQYMDFTNSDLDADAAQSTVPFLDTQAAAPLLPVPLSGAGLYHKGRKHYGGFFAPKVFTYDFSRHMEPVFPVLDDTVN